jgi:hypothetical protein
MLFRAALDREGMPLPQRNNSNDAGNFKIVKNQHLKRLEKRSAQRKADEERRAAAERAQRKADEERRAAAERAQGKVDEERRAAAERAQGKADYEERRTNPSTPKSPAKELKERLPDKLAYYLFVTWIVSMLIEWGVAKAMLPRRASFPGIWAFFIDPFVSGYNLGIWSYMVIGTTALFALSILGVAIASKD